MYVMQQASSVMLLKYFCAYSLTGYFRGLHHSLQCMRGEEQTDNFLLDLIIFLTLLIQLDGGVHGSIEDEDEDEDESEDEGEFKKEVCEAGCECSPCLDKKDVPEAANETVPEVTLTETLPEVAASDTIKLTSEQPKNLLKRAPISDKSEECCVIS
jgi:hypothetical protein